MINQIIWVRNQEESWLVWGREDPLVEEPHPYRGLVRGAMLKQIIWMRNQ